MCRWCVNGTILAHFAYIYRTEQPVCVSPPDATEYLRCVGQVKTKMTIRMYMCHLCCDAKWHLLFSRQKETMKWDMRNHRTIIVPSLHNEPRSMSVRESYKNSMWICMQVHKRWLYVKCMWIARQLSYDKCTCQLSYVHRRTATCLHLCLCVPRQKGNNGWVKRLTR